MKLAIASQFCTTWTMGSNKQSTSQWCGCTSWHLYLEWWKMKILEHFMH